VDYLPNPLEVEDEQIYFEGALYGRNEDNTGWQPEQTSR
jgi:hypothetical protein